MTVPRKNDGFREFILDQLNDLSGLASRAMFGGYGLSAGSKFFGIIHKGRLYFKVAPNNASLYKARGTKPFRPNAKQTLTSYYEVPVDVLEDSATLVQWANASIRR